MILICLLLPILRQRWRCLLYDVYWLPDSCCNVGSKYREYNSSIRTENTLNNRTLDSQTKALNLTKHWMNKSRTVKTGKKQYMHSMFKRLSKRMNCGRPILARVKIFGITEFTIATPFYTCVSSWGISSRVAEFYFLPAGSPVALLRIVELPSTLCGLMPNLQSSTSQIP
jgi:hypothetical protein